MRRHFLRSGETVSRYFNEVKNCANMSVYSKNRILYLQVHWMKGGDGLSQNMEFIYVLPGWKGSASDSRVLRDAVSRRNGLIVPKGFHYLCDAKYTNGERFLTPYRGQRYQLNEWRQGYTPTSPEEFFNMKHCSARNVIERAFGLLKGIWAILISKSYYPVKIQCRIIIACCLLHNLISQEMPIDPIEDELVHNTFDETELDSITYVETSNEWNAWQDNLARKMYDEWRLKMS
ncbi:protein ALP1-like [Momordica charantia]|uniref:Protein ALP1-like n=1 Tax=Momordica charantia TaxID=3673 RepID=A0A6J1DMA5_MOMCH|nr:protein ALP1-like [Momordica charantia]